MKQINEINDKVHIEPTTDALINVNTDVIRFKTKLLAKILLKKMYQVQNYQKEKKKKMYPVLNYFRQNSPKNHIIYK